MTTEKLHKANDLNSMIIDVESCLKRTKKCLKEIELSALEPFVAFERESIELRLGKSQCRVDRGGAIKFLKAEIEAYEKRLSELKEEFKQL